MNENLTEIIPGNGFSNSLEHLYAELKRAELILLSGAKRIAPDNGHHYSSTMITEPVLPDVFKRSPENSFIDTMTHSLQNIKLEIDEKKQESRRSGTRLALCELQRLFDLSSLDIDVILMCLLPEIESYFERYYAYLQDDITRKLPTIHIITKLLSSHLEETLELKNLFDPDAPLIKHNLVHILTDSNQLSSMQASRFVRIDERIMDYLTGRNCIDRNIRSFVHLCQPTIKLQDIVIPRHVLESLSGLINNNTMKSVVFHFQGQTGMGKRTTAEAVCREVESNLLEIDIKGMLTADLPVKKAISLVFREGRLRESAIYLDRCDLLADTEDSGYYEKLLSAIEEYPHPVFISSVNSLQQLKHPGEKLLFQITFDLPDNAARRRLWQIQCQENIVLADDVDTNDLAGRFRLSPGQIVSAISSAYNMAIWRDPEKGVVTGNDLYLACRQQSRSKLNTLTNKASTPYNWDDIILPRDQKEQLQEICNQVKYRYIVYNDWGFGQKLVRGKGLNALFSGPSGTGKTMAAEIMGNELGIDVYKIDLSSIVSKYIGETEKNLDKIFREGATANAIIFFDEADSLFGKRSEVRDSHDRYSNIEISYLLQKIEEYDGVIILATNLRRNMDEAFARRMHFVVEFPMPEESYRYRIWSGMFPEKAPLGPDLDLNFLARQFSITGGNIKNIVVAAAFLAAQDGGLITMEKIIRATKREYQKMGKLCTADDFMNYYKLVKG